MSVRQLARIVLHLALALSVAMPSVASLPSSMSDREAMSIERDHKASASESRVVASIGDDSGCHGDHAAADAPGTSGSPESKPPESAHSQAASIAASADDHRCCGDGDCAAHGCDRAACMHLAWLPRFASLLPLPPAQTRFFISTTPPLSRHADTLLRPPIA